MKRSGISLDDVADLQNLSRAFANAAAGCRESTTVELFSRELERNLAALGEDIRSEKLHVGAMKSFTIRDPKLRTIHAPAFRERVLHHAIMNRVGPVLDRALVDDTFACRKNKGGLAAVQRCQAHLRRFTWFVQIDIKSYFASIDHELLLQQLGRKLKNSGLMRLIAAIVNSYESTPHRGLPIGSLTSQHFANFYLASFDRFLQESLKVRRMVRYMDDILWCCDDRRIAEASLQAATTFLETALRLEIKQPPRTGACHNGTIFCGYRISPQRLLLTRRRKKRYAQLRKNWEKKYLDGVISGKKLQQAYASVLAITVHADARSWRLEQLARNPLCQELEEV